MGRASRAGRAIRRGTDPGRLLPAAGAYALVFLLVPWAAVAQALYLVGMVAATATLACSVRRQRPSPAAPWALVTIALGAAAVGDIAWAALRAVDPTPPQVWWGDLSYLAAYLALSVGLLQLIRLRRPDAVFDLALDVSASTIMGLLLAWELVIRPALAGDSAVPMVERLAAAAYPVGDLALLTLVGWMVLGEFRSSRAVRLLGVGVLSWLVADTAYLVLAQTQAYVFGSDRVVDLLWLAAAVFFAASAGRDGALETTRPPAVRAPAPAPRPCRWRAAATASVVGLLAVPPAVDLATWDRTPAAVELELFAASLALAAIVVVRTWRLGRSRDAVEHLYRVLAANSSDAVAVVDAAGVVLRAFPGAPELLGHPGHRVLGVEGRAVHPDDEAELARVLAAAAAHPGEVVGTELRAGPPDAPRWLALRAVDLRHDPVVGGTVVNVQDVTARRAAEDEARHRALHDPLTGIGNRACFRAQVSAALEGWARGTGAPAVLVVDIDGFKHLNDTVGPDRGDDLLREVADRLAAVVGVDGAVARLGGDEFGALVDAGRRSPERVAEALLVALAEPLVVGGRCVPVRASVGVAAAEGLCTPTSLIAAADLALEQAKATRRGRWVRFDERMRAAAEEELRLEADLAGALGRDELRVVYQPVVALADGTVTGFEALLRWEHPDLGTIGPNRFIPIAERTGLVEPIGLWALGQACRTTVRWQRAYPRAPRLTVAVNLSARQLSSPTLVDDVARVLGTIGIDPAALVLEITETDLVADAVAAGERLGQLRQLGVRLAVDDFGTGYSSLSYLRQFPVDILKIDRSFVGAITPDGDLPAIVRGLLDLGRALSLEVVAEGIELDDQWRQLHAEGCRLGQGYLFARPLHEVDAEALVADLVALRPGHAAPDDATG